MAKSEKTGSWEDLAADLGITPPADEQRPKQEEAPGEENETTDAHEAEEKTQPAPTGIKVTRQRVQVESGWGDLAEVFGIQTPEEPVEESPEPEAATAEEMTTGELPSALEQPAAREKPPGKAKAAEQPTRRVERPEPPVQKRMPARPVSSFGAGLVDMAEEVGGETNSPQASVEDEPQYLDVETARSRFDELFSSLDEEKAAREETAADEEESTEQAQSSRRRRRRRRKPRSAEQAETIAQPEDEAVVGKMAMDETRVKPVEIESVEAEQERPSDRSRRRRRKKSERPQREEPSDRSPSKRTAAQPEKSQPKPGAGTASVIVSGGFGAGIFEDVPARPPRVKKMEPAEEPVVEEIEELAEESRDEESTGLSRKRGRRQRRRKPREEAEIAQSEVSMSLEDVDIGDDDEYDLDEDDERRSRSASRQHQNIPTWDEAIASIISTNLQNRQKSGGGRRGQKKR